MLVLDCLFYCLFGITYLINRHFNFKVTDRLEEKDPYESDVFHKQTQKYFKWYTFVVYLHIAKSLIIQILIHFVVIVPVGSFESVSVLGC